MSGVFGFITGTGGGTSSTIEGTTPPSAQPADPNEVSFWRDTTTETLWAWDVADQVWRSAGLIADSGNLVTLTANTWTNFPTFSMVTTIEDWEIYNANREKLITMETRRRADGWPQMRSLNAHTDITIEVNGYGQIAP